MAEKVIYRFKQARIMKGMSLREAVAAMNNGKSRQWLNKVEKGLIKVDSALMILMSKLYGVPIDYFIPKPELDITIIHVGKIPKWA